MFMLNPAFLADAADVVVNTHHHSELSETVPIVAIVFTFIWLIVKAIMSPFTDKGRRQRGPQMGGLTPDEIEVLHKLQRTITQMESRVEALETILIEQTRASKKYGSKL